MTTIHGKSECPDCNEDLGEQVLEKIKDSREDNFDGYYPKGTTVFVECPKCEEWWEAEFNEDEQVTKMTRMN